MPNLPKLLAGAAIALAGAAALGGAASAEHRDRYRWNGPEGHFVVEARACPDLREDLRDRRHDRGRFGHPGYRERYGDRRDQRVLNCPAHAWHYVPSARERRAGQHGQRLNPTHAVYNARTGSYVVQTRWNQIPVQIDWRGARGHDRYGHRGTGLHFEFRF